MFIVPPSRYFDDYVLVSIPDRLATQQTMELFLDLLRWACDKAGPTAYTFSERVSALGVVFDLSLSTRPTISVRDTERRIQEVVSLIDLHLQKGSMTLKELRGYARPARTQISERLVGALRKLRSRLVGMFQIKFQASSQRRCTSSQMHPWIQICLGVLVLCLWPRTDMWCNGLVWLFVGMTGTSSSKKVQQPQFAISCIFGRILCGPNMW